MFHQLAISNSHFHQQITIFTNKITKHRHLRWDHPPSASRCQHEWFAAGDPRVSPPRRMWMVDVWRLVDGECGCGVGWLRLRWLRIFEVEVDVGWAWFTPVELGLVGWWLLLMLSWWFVDWPKITVYFINLVGWFGWLLIIENQQQQLDMTNMNDTAIPLVDFAFDR